MLVACARVILQDFLSTFWSFERWDVHGLEYWICTCKYLANVGRAVTSLRIGFPTLGGGILARGDFLWSE